MGRHVITKLRINEISGVDTPAQEHALVAIRKRAEPEPVGNRTMMTDTQIIGTPGGIVEVAKFTARKNAEASGRSEAQEFAKLYTQEGWGPLIRYDEQRLRDPFDTVAKRRSADEEYTRLAKAIQVQNGCTLSKAFDLAAATDYGQQLRGQRLAA